MPCHFSHSIYMNVVRAAIRGEKKKVEFEPMYRFRQTLVCEWTSILTTNTDARKKLKKKCIEINGFYTNLRSHSSCVFISRTFLSALKATLHCLYTLSVYQHDYVLSLASFHLSYVWMGWCWCAQRSRSTSSKNRQAHAKREHCRCGRAQHITDTLNAVAVHSTHTTNTSDYNQLCWIRFFLCYAFMFTSRSQSISSAPSYGWFCVHSLI